jgi:hypoxanthine phosphoribosyltransferase
LANTAEYEVPTWNQIHEMLIEQTEKIRKSNYHPDIIVGIARGGIVPMRILTDLLGSPQATTIEIKSYTGIAQLRQRILKQPLTISVINKKILIVDDTAESGQSFEIAKQHLVEKGAIAIRTAALYNTIAKTPLPDYFEKTIDRRVVFPWEIRETLQNILKKQTKNQTTNEEIDGLVKAGLSKQFLERVLKTLL